MARQIAGMRNLGPVTARMLQEVDILTDADLEAIGAVEAYARLKFRFGSRVSLLALYAMEAALLGIDWREVTPEMKAELKRQLELRG